MHKMTPKHGNTIRTHNQAVDSMDGFARKDSLRGPAMAETKKGITTQETHRGNAKGSRTHVPTEFGNKPRAHK